MKQLYTLGILFFLLHSCVPIRIAPTIKGDKIMSGKKFKRKLSKQYSFIFEDPKDANEFYHYINTKYQRNHTDVEYNVPFTIHNKKFFLSFRETEIATKTINLLPFLIDATLEEKGHEPIFEDNYASRRGHWYIVLTVLDSHMKDALHPDYPDRAKVEHYLRNTRIEYLNTTNYVDVLFKK